MNKLYNDTAVQAIANAIRAKNGSSDTYTIAEMSTALNDLSYYAKPIISNVPLATFEADGLPLNSLKVSVEAKQDLHGYDKPWVGGAGNNKLPCSNETATQNGITRTPIYDDDGNLIGMKFNGTASAQTDMWFADSSSISISSECILSCDFTNIPNGVDIYPWPASGHINKTVPSTTLSSVTGVFIRIASGVTLNNVEVYPMIRLASVSDATFAPYSNICPISGWSEVNVGDVDDVDNPTVTQTTTISLPQTVYGGEVDVVNGVLKITDGYIASYNGETLPSTWISSMDAYAEGTTPTTGAEVCYELAEPIIINLTPTLIKSLDGLNNLSVDCGDVIELEYFKEV